MIIRNYLHHVYNFYNDFSVNNYSADLTLQKSFGVREIEHAGRQLLGKQLIRAKNCLEEAKNKDIRTILYTGLLGAENLRTNPELIKWSQINTFGEVVTYGKSKYFAMMCPESPYVEEKLLPEIIYTLKHLSYDEIYFDIPWVIKGSCNCKYSSSKTLTAKRSVRKTLEKVVKEIRTEYPNISIGINSSIPIINNNYNSGGHISNQLGLFDVYVTEWNPFRWNQDVKVLEKPLSLAKKMVENSRTYHATTVTDSKGKILDANKLKDLFAVVDDKGYSLRLGVSPNLLRSINQEILAE